jgi:hypothetical protein
VYEVTIDIDPTVSFIINEYQGSLKIAQKSVLILEGQNFGDPSKNKIQLINTLTDEVTELPAFDLSTEEFFYVSIPEDFPMGEYRIKVFVGAESTFMEELFTIVRIKHEVNSVDKTFLNTGEEIVLTGKYFLPAGNIVKLSKGGPEILCEVITESTTSITAKIPDDIASDEYLIGVKIGSLTVRHFGSISITGVPVPIIASTDKFSYARGETITITGQNLKKIGFATNINFSPFTSGVTQVRSGVAAADGTQVTLVIPGDFTPGTYVLVIEVNGLYSEEYDEVIQITP